MANQLTSGTSVIPFNLIDVQGTTINTENYKGKKLMISFYRYSECMYCNLRIHQLCQRYEEFKEQGLHIIAFFQSPKEDILKSLDHHNIPFPVIAEPDRAIYKQYKVVEHSTIGFLKSLFKVGTSISAMKAGYFMKSGIGSKTLLPADFLVNEDQVISTAFYANDISEHISFEAIESFLKD